MSQPSKLYVVDNKCSDYEPYVKHSSKLRLRKAKEIVKERDKYMFRGKLLLSEGYNLLYLQNAFNYYSQEFDEILPWEVVIGFINVPRLYNIIIKDNTILLTIEYIEGNNFEIFLRNTVKKDKVNDQDIFYLINYIKGAWLFHNLCKDIGYAHRDYFSRHIINSFNYWYYVVDHEIGLINLNEDEEIERYLEEYYQKGWNRFNNEVFNYVNQLNKSVKERIKNEIRAIKKEYKWEIDDKKILKELRKEAIKKSTTTFKKLGIGEPFIVYKSNKRHYLTFNIKSI